MPCFLYQEEIYGQLGIISESQVWAQAAYNRGNPVRLSMKFNVQIDKDIIQRTQSQKSMQGVIRRLVREEIARHFTTIRKPKAQAPSFFPGSGNRLKIVSGLSIIVRKKQ